MFHKGTDNEPKTLLANRNISFSGVYAYGSGFLFDDEDENATPLHKMRELIENNLADQRIFPYIGGQEILQDPLHRHKRFVIDFGKMSEQEATRWADLLEICRTKVKVERSLKSKEVAEWPSGNFGGLGQKCEILLVH